MTTESSPKIAKKFYCEECDIYCSKRTEWTRHINTNKHRININGENINLAYTCKCKKTYKDRSGLWRHSKVCNYTQTEKSNTSCVNTVDANAADTDMEFPINTIINDNEDFKKFIIEVVKNNAELQKQNLELHKKMMDMCSIQNSTVNSHSHNKTFNMQFFLNEQCKDAMNIMEFVDTFKFDFSDLEKVGEVGYVECMSNVIIQKLNDMDIYKRPIHCSDAKRETMFVSLL